MPQLLVRYQAVSVMFNIRLIIILSVMLISSAAIAGTLMLMGIGLSGSGGAPPAPCDGTLDMSTGCIQPGVF